jgi:hypothetical protein
MTTYEEILTTGENKDNNIIAGDENSYLLQVIQEDAIMNPEKPDEELIGVMPPNRALKPNVIDVWIRWIMNGMPQTAEDAAALFVPPTPVPSATPYQWFAIGGKMQITMTIRIRERNVERSPRFAHLIRGASPCK